MRKALFTVCTLVAFLSILSLSCQAQSYCCDPDSGDALGSALECSQEDGGYLPGDGNVCDADCSDYEGGAACIPIDGGLSLLALAGGGLATAAMRRRREEEEAAAQGAA